MNGKFADYVRRGSLRMITWHDHYSTDMSNTGSRNRVTQGQQLVPWSWPCVVSPCPALIRPSTGPIEDELTDRAPWSTRGLPVTRLASPHPSSSWPNSLPPALASPMPTPSKQTIHSHRTCGAGATHGRRAAWRKTNETHTHRWGTTAARGPC